MRKILSLLMCVFMMSFVLQAQNGIVQLEKKKADKQALLQKKIENSKLMAAKMQANIEAKQQSGQINAANYLSKNSGLSLVTFKADDVDGFSGYQLLLDADASVYGSITNEDGFFDYAVYDQFEYMLPEEVNGTITNGDEVSIVIPSGIYDYCVINPFPGWGTFIAFDGADDDYVFEENKHYHFHVRLNGMYDETVITITDQIVIPFCDAITNLDAVVNDYDVTLTWTAPEGNPTGYEVYANGSLITTVTTTTYILNSLSDGMYEFCVKAIFDGSCEPRSTCISNIAVGELCAIVIEMWDEYGDGWNNAKINVTVDGVNYGDFTMPTEVESSEVTVLVPSGELAFIWIAGSYDEECSFQIYDSNNNELYASSGTPTAGLFFTYTNNCQVDDCTPISTFPWTSDFTGDFPPECWTTIDADGDGNNWTGMMGMAFSFSRTMTPPFEDLLNPDNYLITPQIQLTNDNYSVTLVLGGTDQGYFEDKFSVMVSTTGTNPEDFTDIHTAVVTPESSVEAIILTLSLVDYKGQKIYIALRHFDSVGMALVLGGITVEKSSSIIYSSKLENVKIYPNPSKGIVNIDAPENSTIKIVDASGRLIKEYIDTKSININQPSGLYFLQVENNGKTSTHKLIIQ